MAAVEFTMRKEDREEVRQLLADAIGPVQRATEELARQVREALGVVGDMARRHAALEATVALKIPEADKEHAALHARIGRSESLIRAVALLFAGALITAGVAALVRRPEPPAIPPGLEGKINALLVKLQQETK